MITAPDNGSKHEAACLVTGLTNCGVGGLNLVDTPAETKYRAAGYPRYSGERASVQFGPIPRPQRTQE